MFIIIKKTLFRNFFLYIYFRFYLLYYFPNFKNAHKAIKNKAKIKTLATRPNKSSLNFEENFYSNLIS